MLVLCAVARAGDEPANLRNSAPVVSPLERGIREFQLGAAFLLSENFHSDLKPQLNDVDASVRLGWMLNSPSGEGIWRGNFEVLAEVFGGAIVKGPGNLFAGTTVFLRRNIVLSETKWVPYWHVGGGGVYSDAYMEHPQRILGTAFLFNLQAGFGTRYFLTPKNALFLEFDYRHISNAGLAERNTGLNSAATWVGASWFF